MKFKPNVNLEQLKLQYQTLCWIMSYTKPFRARLYVGMLCGILMAGSLFSSFIVMGSMFEDLLPKPQLTSALSTEEVITQIQSDSTLTLKEKNSKIATALRPPPKIDPIEEKVKKIKKTLGKLGIDAPLTYHSESKTVFWGDAWSFQVERNGQLVWQFFVLTALGLILTFGLKNLFGFLNSYYIGWVGSRVVERIRSEIFEKYTTQSLAHYGQGDVGAMISRSTTEVMMIDGSIRLIAADAIRTPLEIVACIGGVAYASYAAQNFFLPILLILGVPLFIAPIYLVMHRIKKMSLSALGNVSLLTSRMHEVFTGIVLIKSSDMEQKEIERFDDINQEYTRNMLKMTRNILMVSPMMEAASVAATIGFLIFTYCNGVPLSNLAAIMAPVFLAYQPLKKVGNIYPQIILSLTAAETLRQTLEKDLALPLPVNPVYKASFEHEIVFDHVSFSYTTTNRQKTIDNFNLTIQRGDVIALVGETGSGKSTIANLLARFYDVTEGSIKFDGVDIRDIDIHCLRKMIGVVSQVPILFNDSIQNNIMYGVENASEAAIVDAAKRARAHTFITDGRHAAQYHTVVGEKGQILSGGERQRIAIARAILKNPPILILDEATSALDTVTEKLVQDAINEAMKDRTVFVIAHRLSTVKNATKILVMDHGIIVESGSHQELYNANGTYRRLCDIQLEADKEA